MKSSYRAALFTAVLAAAIPNASALDRTDVWNSIDSDGDGRISRSEFVYSNRIGQSQSDRATAFERADRNRDGIIDASERTNLDTMAYNRSTTERGMYRRDAYDATDTNRGEMDVGDHDYAKYEIENGRPADYDRNNMRNR